MPRTHALLAAALLPALALAQGAPSVPPPAKAAWILVATSSTGDSHFVTPYQIRQVAQDRFQVWVKQARGKPPEAAGAEQAAGASSYSYSYSYSYSLSRYEFDCAARSSALLQEFRYREDGVEAAHQAGDAAHRPTQPDSLSEASLEAVCQAATAVATQ